MTSFVEIFGPFTWYIRGKGGQDIFISIRIPHRTPLEYVIIISYMWIKYNTLRWKQTDKSHSHCEGRPSSRLNIYMSFIRYFLLADAIYSLGNNSAMVIIYWILRSEFQLLKLLFFRYEKIFSIIDIYFLGTSGVLETCPCAIRTVEYWSMCI